MDNLKIDDRVICIDSFHYNTYNKIGKIIDIDSTNFDSLSILVQFDESIRNGHNGNGSPFTNIIGKQGHCWWLPANSLERIGSECEVELL